MAFNDKNGQELQIGDKINADDGMALRIISICYVKEYNQDCMFGQQIADPLAFCLLTAENLAAQFSKEN